MTVDRSSSLARRRREHVPYQSTHAPLPSSPLLSRNPPCRSLTCPSLTQCPDSTVTAPHTATHHPHPGRAGWPALQSVCLWHKQNNLIGGTSRQACLPTRIECVALPFHGQQCSGLGWGGAGQSLGVLYVRCTSSALSWLPPFPSSPTATTATAASTSPPPISIGMSHGSVTCKQFRSD